MARRPLVLVSVTLIVAMTVLVMIGRRVLDRDREALFASYGRERQQSLEGAARGLSEQVNDIGEDLELAATLLQGTTSVQLAEHELNGIATIKREYVAIYARIGGAITKVAAIDAPVGAAQRWDSAMVAMLDTADRQPGTLRVSSAPPAATGADVWYRVFARRLPNGLTVAVLVDTQVLLGRLKVRRDAMTRMVILDGHDAAAASSDPGVAALVRTHPELRAGGTIDGELAGTIGLPESTAVVAAIPMVVDDGAPWTLLVVASTHALQEQEQTIVRRVFVGGALVLVLLLSAAAYVLHNTFRARALRERLRIEQRLLHSEKLVTAGQLAAGIAHEVGTPLGVARGRVELALSHLGTTHPDADNQRIAIEQIDRVTRLLQQLLDYVRPDPGAVQVVEVATAMQSTAELLAARATKRKVALHVEAGGETLRADPDQVQQILVNLSLNAIDACEAGGNVWLRTRARDGAVVLEIVDDGAGISPELHQQVFDPFFTTKKRGQGTGLGLWVVAQLVRARSAEIELDSAPGKGTTVRVVWPA